MERFSQVLQKNELIDEILIKVSFNITNQTFYEFEGKLLDINRIFLGEKDENQRKFEQLMAFQQIIYTNFFRFSSVWTQNFSIFYTLIVLNRKVSGNQLYFISVQNISIN